MSSAEKSLKGKRASDKKSDNKPAASEPKATSNCDESNPVELACALVIDDEPANRDFLVRLLQQAKLDVKGASTAADARAILATAERMDLIAVDHRLPDGDGVDLMAELHAKFPRARMIMATMLDDRPLMDKAFANGCDVFLVKPHGFMELFRRIQVAQATGEDTLTCMVIDQYGPRPYRD